MFAMNGRLLLLLFILPLLYILNIDAADIKKIPFYLIPVLSLDGKTTDTGECIGTLITLEHILAPAECLKVKTKIASGVFIDFRAEKKYPENKDLFPITEYTFSKKIVLDPTSKLAIITLHVPFLQGNSLNIEKTLITPKVAGSTVHFERNKQLVNLVDGTGKVASATYSHDGTLVSLSAAAGPISIDKALCNWITKIANTVECKA
uniref:Peptidase S1 domain-containing protein n=1 Tax=Panagrolaimus superbus TaxID=310955 RepID=A0A914Z4V6_9BILA